MGLARQSESEAANVLSTSSSHEQKIRTNRPKTRKRAVREPTLHLKVLVLLLEDIPSRLHRPIMALQHHLPRRSTI